MSITTLFCDYGSESYADALLLESGGDLLLESGGVLLME